MFTPAPTAAHRKDKLMSGLVESVVQRTEAEAAERRQLAAIGYGEILARNSQPQKGDEAALLAAAAALGRTVADLAEDAKLVVRLVETEGLAAQVRSLDSERAARNVELGQVLHWAAQSRVDLEAAIQAKIDPATAANSNAEHAFSIARQAASDLRSLQDRWAALVLGVSLEDLQTARHKELAAQCPPALKGGGFAVPDGLPGRPARRVELANDRT